MNPNKSDAFIAKTKHFFSIFSAFFASPLNFRPFLNTVTSCDKYSLISRDKWMQTIQMHLSQKQNIFSEFFSAFFEYALNLEHFQNKMTLIAYVFSKLPTTKDGLTWMSKNYPLRGPLNRWHGKRAGTLIQSWWEHLYQLVWSLWRYLKSRSNC